MQNESKGVYVQMPKPEPNNEAERLLAALVKAIDVDDLTDFDYNALIAAKEYLEGKGVVVSDKVPWLLTTASGVTKY